MNVECMICCLEILKGFQSNYIYSIKPFLPSVSVSKIQCKCTYKLSLIVSKSIVTLSNISQLLQTN